MALSAAEVLKAAEAREAAAKSLTTVDRPLDQVNDAGNLLGIEDNDLDLEKLKNREEKEDYLTELARDNLQLLFNDIFKLPTQRVDDVLCVVLPPPTYKLPRAKPLPTPKTLTKWEEFAKAKGIVNKKTKGAGKKPRLTWDDQVKEWVPNYGYKKNRAEDKKNWMMHYKGDDADDEDPFEKAAEDKKERVAKNELQRLRNIARSKKVKVPGVGLTPVVSNAAAATSSNLKDKDELQRAADLAKKSTASLGKFQEKLRSSKLEQKAATMKPKGKKRKFDAVVSKDGSEKERMLKVLESISNKQPKLDMTKAVGQKIHQEDSDRSAERKRPKKGKKSGKGGKGGKRAGNSHFKGRGGGPKGAGAKKGGKGKR